MIFNNYDFDKYDKLNESIEIEKEENEIERENEKNQSASSNSNFTSVSGNSEDCPSYDEYGSRDMHIHNKKK